MNLPALAWRALHGWHWPRTARHSAPTLQDGMVTGWWRDGDCSDCSAHWFSESHRQIHFNGSLSFSLHLCVGFLYFSSSSPPLSQTHNSHTHSSPTHQVFHTQLFHYCNNSFTFSTFTYNALKQSILHHLLCLSCLSCSASFLLNCRTPICNYRKKLTCGVIWSFNFKLIQFLKIPLASQATGSTFACALRMARKVPSIAPNWKLVPGEGYSRWKKTWNWWNVQNFWIS